MHLDDIGGQPIRFGHQVGGLGLFGSGFRNIGETTQNQRWAAILIAMGIPDSAVRRSASELAVVTFFKRIKEIGGGVISPSYSILHCP